MGTPKKPISKKTASKSTGAKKAAPAAEEPIDPKAKKKIIDDEDEDEDFDIALDDELGGYESFDSFEEEDDY